MVEGKKRVKPTILNDISMSNTIRKCHAILIYDYLMTVLKELTLKSITASLQIQLYIVESSI